MDQITPRAAARIVRFLTEESVVWVSTVRPDGGPHIVPIWFWWDGEAILLFSKPDAQKVRNLRAKPSVMLAVGEPDDDFDVGMIRGRAELLSRPTNEVMPPAHLEKYRQRMAAIGLSADEYAATYSQVIRIVPQDFLGWHGRTVPPSERIAGVPARSIAEPVNPAASELGGEPISDRTPGRADAPTRDRSPLPDGRMQPADALRSWLRRLGAAPLARGNGSA